MGLLEELDYRNVRLYAGGMVDWTKHRLPVERGRGDEDTRANQPFNDGAGHGSHVRPASKRHRWERVLIDAVSRRSIGELLLLWLLMITGFGVLYWIAGVSGGASLDSHGKRRPNVFNQKTVKTPNNCGMAISRTCID